MFSTMDLSTAAGKQELGTRIQSAIMGAGFDSLPEFARQMGWSRALIYQYVSGRVLVQLDRLGQIATHTGKPLEWFLSSDPGAQASRAAELAFQAERQVATLKDELAVERELRLTQEDRGRSAELSVRAQLCRALRRTGQATALVEAASAWLELARQAGDDRGVLEAQLQMGHAWFLQGEMGRAREVLLEALQTAAERADETVLNSARQELLRVLLQAGQLTEARRVAGQLADSTLWWPRWSGRLSLVAIASQAGDLAQAREHLAAGEAVIEGGEESADRRALARTYLLSNRVTVALLGGDYALADEHNEQLRSQAAQAGVSDQLRESELNRALIALRRGRLAEAREGLRRLEEWALLADDTRLRVLTQVFSSELLRRCGDLEGARQTAQVAVDEATAVGQPHAQVEAALALGQAYRAAGRTDEARYQLERAATQAAKLHLARLQWQARLFLAEADGATDVAAVQGNLQQLGLEDIAVEAALMGAPDGLSAAVEQARRLGYFWGEHAALLQLTGQALTRGASAEGAAYLNEAQACSKAAGVGECLAVDGAETEMAARLADAAQSR